MKIVNLRDKRLSAGTRRVDRRSPFGNPFRIGCDGDREEVIRKFAVYFRDRLRSDAAWRRKVEGLAGAKALACWCAPEKCHAEVIRDYLEELRKRP